MNSLYIDYLKIKMHETVIINLYLSIYLSICQKLLTLLLSCVHSENLVIEATLKQQLIYELVITSLYTL